MTAAGAGDAQIELADSRFSRRARSRRSFCWLLLAFVSGRSRTGRRWDNMKDRPAGYAASRQTDNGMDKILDLLEFLHALPLFCAADNGKDARHDLKVIGMAALFR